MNEFHLPFYLEVRQTRNFTIIQYNKVINITIYYFKIWLYDHVNQYYSEVYILLGCGGTLPGDWCCVFWDHCVVSEHQAPSDTAPHPENRGLKCTAVKLMQCYFYWMVVQHIISSCSALSNQRFILFCWKHIRCWKYLIKLLDVDMLYYFHIFYRWWSACSLDLGILTLNTGLYVVR